MIFSVSVYKNEYDAIVVFSHIKISEQKSLSIPTLPDNIMQTSYNDVRRRESIVLDLEEV